MRKYWTKARPKTSWANSKLCISMSDVKMLFRSPTPFSFVDCNTLLPPGLIEYPVLLSRCSKTLASPTSWRSPRQSRLHLHSFMKWFFRLSCKDIPDMCLASADFLNRSLKLKSEPRGRSCQVLLLAGTGTWPPYSIVSSPVFCFPCFPPLPVLDCPGTCSVDQAGLRLRDQPASAS